MRHSEDSIAYCHTCRKQRRYWRGLCTSCGSDCKASYEPVQRQSAGMICPGCHSSRKVEVSRGRWRCLTCSSLFERPDFGPYVVHQQPDKSAEQNERHRRRKGR